MKTLRLLGIALTAIILGLSLNSCSDEDNGEPTNGELTKAEKAFIGTWVCDDGSDETMKMIIKKDHTGNITWYWQGKVDDTANFTWKITETTLTIKYPGEEPITAINGVHYRFEGNKLYMDDSEPGQAPMTEYVVYVKQS